MLCFGPVLGSVVLLDNPHLGEPSPPDPNNLPSHAVATFQALHVGPTVEDMRLRVLPGLEKRQTGTLASLGCRRNAEDGTGQLSYLAQNIWKNTLTEESSKWTSNMNSNMSMNNIYLVHANYAYEYKYEYE